jgi:hypothetical protein
MSGHEMRKHALRRYLVFRIKLMEFLDIDAMRQGLEKNEFLPRTPVNRITTDFIAALRTAEISWFAIFIDQTRNGTNVLDLWKELFPQHTTEIDTAWAQMKPAWVFVRKFRDEAGFHSGKPTAFFNARADILVQRKLIDPALEEFKNLLGKMLRAEKTELADWEKAVDELLDEQEAAHGFQYKRDEFKKYLMIPKAIA